MAILGFINDFFKEGKTVKLSSFIRNGIVQFLKVKSRDEALQQLVAALQTAGKIENDQAFYEALLKREKIVSTGIGMGVAIPHAKLTTYCDFFVAVGVQKEQGGIEWDALDGALVKLIFMIGGPADKQTEYLQILSGLTTAIKEEKLRQRVHEAASTEEIVELFSPY